MTPQSHVLNSPKLGTARLESDGDFLDSWSGDGMSALNIEGATSEVITDIAYYPTSPTPGLLFGGYAVSAGSSKFLFGRYNLSGGLVWFDTVNLAGNGERVHGVDYWNERIFAAGDSVSDGDLVWSFAMVGADDGALDSACDDNGIFGTTFFGKDNGSAQAVAVDATGSRFALAGYVWDSGDSTYATLVVYETSDCDLVDATVLTEFPDSRFNDVADNLSAGSPGFYAAGSFDGKLLAAAFDETAALDSAFHSDGIRVTDLTSSTDEYASAVSFRSGKMVSVGTLRSSETSLTGVLIARYTTSGALDSTCEGNGLKAIYDDDDMVGEDVVIDASSIWVAAEDEFGPAVLRLEVSDCDVDETFGDDMVGSVHGAHLDYHPHPTCRPEPPVSIAVDSTEQPFVAGPCD